MKTTLLIGMIFLTFSSILSANNSSNTENSGVNVQTIEQFAQEGIDLTQFIENKNENKKLGESADSLKEIL